MRQVFTSWLTETFGQGASALISRDARPAAHVVCEESTRRRWTCRRSFVVRSSPEALLVTPGDYGTTVRSAAVRFRRRGHRALNPAGRRLIRPAPFCPAGYEYRRLCLTPGRDPGGIKPLLFCTARFFYQQAAPGVNRRRKQSTTSESGGGGFDPYRQSSPSALLSRPA